MKTFLSFCLLVAGLQTAAQWSNTSNQFYDSLHMQVSIAAKEQQSPLVLKSYPDSGYFVIWQDDRNAATTKTDIYAQKYSKTGQRLWAMNGVPVANGPNAQHYTFSSNQDYRNRSFAATDSAGGFYLCYADDSITNYSWSRIAVQHMRSNGTPVFPGTGYLVATTPKTENYTLGSPFLVADGRKGFFISFVKTFYSNQVYVQNYRDENGVMKSYGGDIVNQNATQRYRNNTCGIQPYLDRTQPTVIDYNIWYDGQGGCNVIMSMNMNDGTGNKLAFNRLWRARKDSKTRILRRNNTGVGCQQSRLYKKDQVYLLNQLQFYFTTTTCTDLQNNVYVVTNEILISNGFGVIDQGAYNYYFPKGVTLTTSGNINVDLIAVTRRTYENNTVSAYTVQGYSYKVEKFDSIPYQYTSYGNPDLGYNYNEPPLDTLKYFRDTLLASSVYPPDFTLAAGGGKFYVAGLLNDLNTGTRRVKLKTISLVKKGDNAFNFIYNGPETGLIIGSEQSTGFTGTDIFYDQPFITVAADGTAVFHIREYGRSTRVSPLDGTELRWGAMGRPIGTGSVNKGYYRTEQPVLALDPANGTGIVAWNDSRYIPPTSTGSDIYMRHIDRLKDFNYRPPARLIRKVPNPYGSTEADPMILYGTSGALTPIEIGGINYEPSTTTIAAIVDNYDFGRFRTYLNQNTGALRKSNGAAYLDRNLTVSSEKTPPNMLASMYFYFTKDEFNLLKNAENGIETPADLSIVNQPFVPGSVPTTYTPVANEKIIKPLTWDSVPGGYYLFFTTTRFGNFFVFKSTKTQLCPGGTITLDAGITGSSYKWFMNIGTGYYAVTNDANIAGASSSSLQLKNVPSSWYGYKFRCQVDGSKFSDEFELQFINSWSGAVNGNWNNTANWSCGAVPDANTDVVINAGSVVVNVNGVCRTLTVQPGAGLKVNAGNKLDVKK